MTQSHHRGGDVPIQCVDLLIAAGVPDRVTQRLAEALAAAGVTVLRDTSPGHARPPEMLLCLHAEIDAPTAHDLLQAAAMPSPRILGIALGAAPTADGMEAAAGAWDRLGLPRESLLIWDGVSPPHQILRRLCRASGPGAAAQRDSTTTIGPVGGAAADGVVLELVLRNGRVLRIPPDLPEPMLRRLLDRLDD